MIKRKTIFLNGEETNYEISSDGHVYNKKTKRELKGTMARNEYHSVQLTVNGKPKTLMVHRLVAEAFCENPNNYNIVDHIDRNKTNNDYINLRWVTQKENASNIDRKKNKKLGSFIKFDEKDWKQIQNSLYYVNKEGQIFNQKTNKLLVGSLRNGYKRVGIGDKKYSVHRLVWEAFNGEIPEGMVIDHIDGDRSNNKIENLRLVSQSENMNNAQKLGHKGQVKIKQYDSNGVFIQEYLSIEEAAKAIKGNAGAITKAAERYGKSSNYFWIKDNQNITIEEVLKNTKSNKPKSFYIGVSQYSKDGDFIKHYESLKEAANENNCASSSIKRAAKAKRIGLNFYWILDDDDITIQDLLNK